MTSEHSPTIAGPPAAAGARRLHHLDALRGGALLLGVLLHAIMPFFPTDELGPVWLVDDASGSWAAVGTVGVIHLFRMILFMMLAGYFGHMVLHRRGPGAYLRDRALRIGLPLVVFWPLLFALVLTAIVLNGLFGAMPPPGGAEAPGGLLDLPTMHLWFLLLLLEIVVVVVAGRAVLTRLLGARRAERASHALGRALSAPWGLLLVAVSYAAGLLLQGGLVTGLDESTTLMPDVGASIGYAGAFLAGWFLRAQPGALDRVESRWIVLLAIAVPLTPLALLSPAFAPAAVGAVLTAVAGWAWTLGLTGLCRRLVRREIGWVRYLADASYWVYLMHFPLLLLVAVPLSGLALPIIVKLLITLATVMAVLLLSYDLMVRSTWIGKWLNGRRHPRALFRRASRAR